MCYSPFVKNLLRLAVILCAIGASIGSTDEANDEERISNETEIRTVIETKTEFATDACMASLEIEYYQKGASAHVETELTNDNCAASSGSYVIQVRYRDADGINQAKDFEETWERSDANSIVVKKDYFVADNIDILRVRSRKLSCICTPDETPSGD